VDEPQSAGVGRAFRTYLDIALFRRGPEDLPASSTLLLVTIGISIFLGLVLQAALPLPEHNRIGVALVEAAFVTAWYWALLRIARRPERFLQTTSAVFGVSLVLLPLHAIAKLLWAGHPPDDIPPLALLIGIQVEIWLLAANARILRAATQWPFFACIAIMLLQSVVALLVIASLFPDALQAAAAGAKPTP
jgi:hypothetical protein